MILQSAFGEKNRRLFRRWFCLTARVYFENEKTGDVGSMNIMVETSARHIHLTQEDLDALFGKDYQLTPKKDLSQPGQFACAEKVEVVGPKSSLKLSILGPVRPETQIEVRSRSITA